MSSPTPTDHRAWGCCRAVAHPLMRERPTCVSSATGQQSIAVQAARFEARLRPALPPRPCSCRPTGRLLFYLTIMDATAQVWPAGRCPHHGLPWPGAWMSMLWPSKASQLACPAGYCRWLVPPGFVPRPALAAYHPNELLARRPAAARR